MKGTRLALQFERLGIASRGVVYELQVLVRLATLVS
jgi:hypothetical protein